MSKQESDLQRPPQIGLPEGNLPLVAPIYHSLKYTFPSVASLECYFAESGPGFIYASDANPTSKALEQSIAAVQGRDACLLTNSGTTALCQLMLALVRPEDCVLGFYQSYKPTRTIMTEILGRLGIRSLFADLHDHQQIEQLVARHHPRVIAFESPTNPANHIADLSFLTALASEHGAKTIMDNTFAGLHQHGSYAIDFFVHSLTKYVGGHGDLMGGAIVASEDLLQPLRPRLQKMGCALDPQTCYQMQRGLKTYHLRYRHMTESATRLAQFLSEHPKAQNVRYPSLLAGREGELARTQLTDFGTVVSCDIGQDKDSSDRWIDSLQRFTLAPSLGSTDSLVAPSKLFYGYDLDQEQLRMAEINERTVRLSVGLEDAGDLIADLSQAFAEIS